MAFAGAGGVVRKFDLLLNQMVARPRFQDWAAQKPIMRWFARRDGARLFDLVQGFVRAQALFALVDLDIPRRLMEAPATAATLAWSCDIEPRKMELLLRSGVAIGILRERRDGNFTLTRQGAALCGVPGLQDMILHHGAFYRDLGDPVALLRGKVETELADFWPYVLGGGGSVDPEVSATYSRLMAETQTMVAKDTLQMVSLAGVSRLLDVGGGTGAFLFEVARAYPQMKLALLDLPHVADQAVDRAEAAGLSERIAIHRGSFLEADLPKEIDAVSLIRVLYDHDDETVRALLGRVFDALPSGGGLIISEPMSGGRCADPVTDVYFAFYTLAMRTGQVRSAERISELLRGAGFCEISNFKPPRPYVTAAVTAVKRA